MKDTQITDAMAETAIAWFARLRADDVTDDDRVGFVMWLRLHRMHQFAFIEVLDLWEDLAMFSALDFEEFQQFTQLWNLKRPIRTGNTTGLPVTVST
jgi:ferric-dicitrate binding protein FerR (iron transport regulator)